MILAIGLPGSGKSTYFDDLKVNPISSDGVRLQLVDDERDQTINTRVFSVMRYLLQQRIELRRPVTYLDATNITRRDRRPFLDLARRYECDLEALFFDTPLAVCKIRNSSRTRVVPNHALDLMAAKLIPPSLEEGFSRVVVVGYPRQKHPPVSAN